MAYDEVLADRIHALLSGYDGLGEKKMFGGVGYLLHGNMASGILLQLRIECHMY